MVIESDSRDEWRRRALILVLMFVYLIYVLVITLNPFEFSNFRLSKMIPSGFMHFLSLIFHFDIIDIVVNILLFIPFGALVFFLLRRGKVRKDRRSLWIPICAGALLSLVIEGTQLFLDRTSSIVDLLANTGGTVLGFFGVEKWVWVRRTFGVFHHRSKKFLLRFLAVLIYGIAFIGLVSRPFRLNNLKNWDEGFHLLIGNEETLDRPWEGEVFLVAIYDRALRLSEIRDLCGLGMDETGLGERKTKGTVVLYSFSEGVGDTIRDLSEWGGALDLVGQEVVWLENGRGVEIREGRPLRSSMSGKKIVRALRETSQMTVEVWIRTGNLTQSGPARIVSLSVDTNRRNFTLGQNGQDVHFRVRTPLTGPNGSRIRLRAKAVLRDREIHHLVATFNRGVERLVVDGRPTGGVIRGDIDYLPDLVEIGRNTTAKIAFCFGVVFPFSLLVCGLFGRGRFVYSLFFVGGFVFFVELFYYVWLGQPFGFLFFSVSLVAATLGGVVGYVFDEKDLTC